MIGYKRLKIHGRLPFFEGFPLSWFEYLFIYYVVTRYKRVRESHTWIQDIPEEKSR